MQKIYRNIQNIVYILTEELIFHIIQWAWMFFLCYPVNINLTVAVSKCPWRSILYTYTEDEKWRLRIPNERNTFTKYDGWTCNEKKNFSIHLEAEIVCWSRGQVDEGYAKKKERSRVK